MRIDLHTHTYHSDGCVRFEKNRTDYYYYPRIEFGVASKDLIEDLFYLLTKLDFKVNKWSSKRKEGMEYKISLPGFKNLDKWIKEVKPSNKKHLDRIEKGLLNKSKIALKKCSTNL